MSYSQDTLLLKFGQLDELPQSIVSISQWVLFHRSHAEKTAQAWAKFIANAPSSKKLSIIYLANEVVQQARAKKKLEFIDAFGKVLPKAIGEVYPQLRPDTQARVKRVVEIWTERRIFSPAIITALELKVSDTDLASSKKPPPSSVTIPPALLTLSSLHKAESDASTTTRSQVSHFQADFDRLFDSDTLPSPALYAAKLSALQTSHESVTSSLKSLVTTRRSLVDELRRMLSAAESNLAAAETQVSDLESKRERITETKEEVDAMLGETKKASGSKKTVRFADEPLGPTAQAQAEVGVVPAAEDIDDYVAPPSQDIDEYAAPTYSPLSSDEDEPTPKKAKTEEPAPKVEEPTAKSEQEADSKTDEAAAGVPAVEGLDPSVAAFLSSLIQNK